MKQIEWSKAYESWGVSMAALERSYSPARLLDVLRGHGPGPRAGVGARPVAGLDRAHARARNGRH
jgi:hypothetical protein